MFMFYVLIALQQSISFVEFIIIRFYFLLRVPLKATKNKNTRMLCRRFNFYCFVILVHSLLGTMRDVCLF